MNYLKAVLFDLDGVLISTDELHYQSWEMLTKDEGIFFDRTINRRLLGVSRMSSLAIVLEKANKTYNYEEKKALAALKNKYYIEMVQQLTLDDLLPGAIQLIENLKNNNILTAVCSGSKNARYILKHLNMQDMFMAIIDGNDITETKPNPQIFLKGAKQLGVSPSECVVVEDAEVGVKAALNAGMKVIGINKQPFDNYVDYYSDSLEKINIQIIRDL
ncbi:MAG: beta-phosphoglucomutase [Verrucomicrobiota bacterium]|nr:beta-phosphoglucomutase [Verrucomicrobiota bacterium]